MCSSNKMVFWDSEVGLFSSASPPSHSEMDVFLEDAAEGLAVPATHKAANKSATHSAGAEVSDSTPLSFTGAQ